MEKIQSEPTKKKPAARRAERLYMNHYTTAPLLGLLKEDPFTPLNRVLKKWFCEPDLQAMRITLGVIKARHLELPPVWLLLVGPSSCGKTTMHIIPVSGLPGVRSLGRFTPKGLRRLLGQTRNTVFSMKRFPDQELLRQLQYDGDRMTLIAEARPPEMRAMVPKPFGGRFLQLCLHRPPAQAGLWSICQRGDQQAELTNAMRQIFEQSSEKPPVLGSFMKDHISDLVDSVAWDPERTSESLVAISKGIAALNRRSEVAEEDVIDAFRCLPARFFHYGCFVGAAQRRRMYE